MAFTEQQRQAKWLQLRQEAELEWVDVFSSRHATPDMNMNRILMVKAADLRMLTQVERNAMQQAMNIQDKLKDKITYLDSLSNTQQAEFDALTWTSTP
jgi:hypothetical protein